MNNPKVSIIVPVYNPGPYLKPFLNSVCSQSLTDIEILLTDDGSTDGSVDILNDYAKHDDRIKLFLHNHYGQPHAINNGRMHAMGEYVLISDDDDELLPNALKSLYEAANHEADFVKGSAIAHHIDTGESEQYTAFQSKRPLHSWQELDKIQQCEFFLEGPELWSFLIRNDFQKNIPLADAIYNDTGFVFKLKTLAKDMRFISNPVYKWNVHSDSTSHKDDEYAFDIIKVYDDLERFLKSIPLLHHDIWEILALSRYFVYSSITKQFKSQERFDSFMLFFIRDVGRDVNIYHLLPEDPKILKSYKQLLELY